MYLKSMVVNVSGESRTAPFKQPSMDNNIYLVPHIVFHHLTVQWNREGLLCTKAASSSGMCFEGGKFLRADKYLMDTEYYGGSYDT